MSSETERITNEVLNRHPWDELERRIHNTHFEGEERRQRTTDELRDPNEGLAGTGDAILESPQ
jgi:hypothetical protein